MNLKKAVILANLLCGLFMSPSLCEGASYTVIYDGNGANSGKMANHTYTIGTDETTQLDENAYKQSYTLSYDVDGGTAIDPTEVDYTFAGWLHEDLLTEVTNNFKANWTAMSYDKYDNEVPGMFTLSNYNNGVNNYTVKTSTSCWEHLYSEPIYMPAGTFTLNFKECSSTGIAHLSIENSWLFKVSACDRAQIACGGDQGLLTSGDASSAVVIDTEASTEMKDYTFDVFSVGGPVYISINGGNLYDGRTYKLSFSDFVLSYNGSTSLTYADQEPTANMVREEGGTIKLKAQWEPTSVTLPTPEKEGYTFVGWNTKSDGTGDNYNAGDEYTPTADQTLHAMWKPKEISKAEYTVVYDGNGATSGKMANHTYTIGTDETTQLDENTYKQSYTLSYDVDGGTAIAPTEVDYTFAGWLHDTLLTEVTNNMENWNNVTTNNRTGRVSDTSIIVKYENGVNSITANTLGGTKERFYSRAIYVPAGNYDLTFKFCSPTGYSSLQSDWESLFKMSACNIPQATSGSDEGRFTSGTNKSAVVLGGNTASDVLEDRSLTIYANDETPVYLATNYGNVEDWAHNQFKFADLVLSINGKSYLIYEDETPTINLVREDGGTVKLKAQWEPTSATLPTPEKEGYTFEGWSTNANGTGELLAAGDTYTPTEDTKFYAIWKEIEEPEEEVEPIEEEEQDTTITMLPIIPAKYVTPNGDGMNDTWIIKNLDQFSIYKVTIYDRFGKKLITYKNNYDGFDGTYNGNPLPSTDYWFVIDLEEIDQQMTGHFTLLH